jgi:hypothetical protein
MTKKMAGLWTVERCESTRVRTLRFDSNDDRISVASHHGAVWIGADAPDRHLSSREARELAAVLIAAADEVDR